MNEAPDPHLEVDSETVVLKDALTVLIRPLRSEDKRILESAFLALSPETRYRRFFAPLTRLSHQDLVYLTEVDHHDHEAVVAINPENGSLIGVARFVRSDDPTEAEVAVVVGDPWQGHGVAGALLERLTERAREEGINHFVAIVMSDNEEALNLFRNLSPRGSTTRLSASGHTELLIELPEPGELHDSRLYRVLSVVAQEAIHVNPWRMFRQAIRRRPTEEMRLPPPSD